jgi:molecular chaperone DnaK
LDTQSKHLLLLAAEEAKQALSARVSAVIRVVHNGAVQEVPLSRAAFEERTADLLYRTSITSRQVLTAAGLKWSDIDRVLLVGGSTRMPMVRRMLKEITGREPHSEVNPDEAVARGAALYAAHVLSSQQPAAQPLQVTNVSAHSLGITGFDVKTGRRCNTIVIPRNSSLPARKSRKFVTRKIAQQSIVVQVLEGESTQPENCTQVGRLVIRNLPPGLAAGAPVKVTYEYGTNGRLSVSAQVPGTECAMRIELERTGERSAGQIAVWRQVLASEPTLAQFQPIIEAEAVEEKNKQGLTGDEVVSLLDDEPRPVQRGP